MKFHLRSFILSILVLFFSLVTDAQGFLHTSGKYIYDGSGNEVILRGIGTGNWMLQEGYMMQTSGVAGTQHEFRAKLAGTIGEEKADSFYNVWLDSHFREIDADSMKSWGFNSVRVAMHYKWFTPPIEKEPVAGEITWLDKGFTMIDSLLDWCGKNEMYLILDLHGAPGGQGKDSNISDYDNTKPSLWESQANKNKTIALWRKLAERYSSEPWIGGYDLINETNWTFPEGNNSQLKNLFVAITNAIREVDQNHIIFIEGNSFANDFSGLTPPWDNNMVYSFHKYWNNNTQESLNFALNLRNTHNRPIWLGETGENSNTWFTSLIMLCEKNHIGWSWWPVKKAGINNPLKVTVNSDYTQLVNYWKGSASKPTVDNAFNAVLQFANNHRLENCTFQKDVIDAMFRQTITSATKPYKLYSTDEPIFFTNFNLGRNGYAYFDNDTVNVGGAKTVWNQGNRYRNDGVDIEPCTDAEFSNGYNVGWTEDNEWLEYTVDVDSTAAYSISIKSATSSGGAKVHFEENGLVISSLITLPVTGGYQVWRTTMDSGIILNKGTHKLRLVFDKGGSNLNYFMISGPKSIDSVSLKNLYAESSVDGTKVFLSLNKPITSEIVSVKPNDFSVTINNIPLETGSISLGASPGQLIIDLADTLFYGGTIKISYSGNSIFSAGQALEQFSNMPVINMLPIRYTLPTKIQAEDFSKNSGMVSETCTDTGGGSDMGYAAPGDYLDYRVYVPQSKYYTLSFRVATSRASSQLIVKAGEVGTFTDVDTLEIASTGDWQVWKTLPLTVFLKEGRYTIRLYVKAGEFNINWFQTVSASGVGVDLEESSKILVYPNPSTDFVTIELPVSLKDNMEITIINNLGQVVKCVNPINLSRLQIETADFKKGLYSVIFRKDKAVLLTSKLIIL